MFHTNIKIYHVKTVWLYWHCSGGLFINHYIVTIWIVLDFFDFNLVYFSAVFYKVTLQQFVGTVSQQDTSYFQEQAVYHLKDTGMY